MLVYYTIIFSHAEGTDTEVDLSNIDIHAVTSALKLYLRELPIPLITYEAYDLCVIAISELSWLPCFIVGHVIIVRM